MSRRSRFTLLCLLALSAVAKGPPAYALDVAVAAGPKAPAPAPVKRKKPFMFIMGDSNIWGHLGRQMQPSFEKLGYRVYRRGKPYSGLSRPDFFDWIDKSPFLIRSLTPEVVVIMLGGNDAQVLSPLRGSDAAPIPWEDEAAWVAEYERRVERLVGVLASGGATVYFLSPTNRKPIYARQAMHRIIGAQRRAVERTGLAVYVDTYVLTSHPNGEYIAAGEYKGHPVPYRYNDGIHLSPPGAIALRERLLPLITTCRPPLLSLPIEGDGDEEDIEKSVGTDSL
ncbi:MAG: DUF459 domain-containing protein [Myxococcales bacterium]|nr:DUF459 domain-containing protein [Myxococcales bacterium]